MLLFGGQYVIASNALQVLAFAAFVQTIFGGGGHTLTMTGFTNINLFNSVIAVVTNVILNIMWIPVYGIMGAAYATLVSMLVLGGLRLVEVQKFVKINPFSLKLLKPVIAGSGMYLILTLIKPSILPLHTILSLFIVSIVGSLSFYLILWLLKFDDDDKEVWSGIRMITNKK